METIKELFDRINWAHPTDYYFSANGFILPRYAEFYELIIEFKRETSSTHIGESYDRENKLKRKLRRVEKIRRKLADIIPITPESRILDLGSGFGMEAVIWRYLTGASVYAVDIKPKVVSGKDYFNMNAWHEVLSDVLDCYGGGNVSAEQVRHRYAVFDVIGDAKVLPFQDNSFDFVFSLNALEHFVDIKSAIKEVLRVLKPGRVFYFRASNYHSILGPHIPGIIDIPWAHVVLSKDEVSEIKKTIDASVLDDDLKLFYEVSENTLSEWSALFSPSRWGVIEWNLCRDPGLSIEDIPEYIFANKSGRITVDDVLVEDIEAVLIKKQN